MWNSLSQVEESRNRGQSASLPCCLVYAINWNGRNPFPHKFFYLCCPHREDGGHVCGKSVEFRPKCDHDMEGKPFYCFHLVLMDAIYGGVPMIAQLWEMAAISLKCLPREFAKLSYLDQILKVHCILQKPSKMRVSLFVNKGEVRIQHLSIVYDGALVCGSPLHNSPLPAPDKGGPNTPMPKKSAKKLLARLIEELHARYLED